MVEGRSHDTSSAATGHHWEIPEGQECPTCKRRVPRKKKPTSPVTKPYSFRIPIDDWATFEEMIVAAAKNAGLHESGHWRYWTVLRGLVHVLQEPPSGE